MAARDDQPAELRIGSFQLTVLRVYSCDVGDIQAYVADQVAQAPALLTGAAVVIDPAELASPVADDWVHELLNRLRFCGLQPIAWVAEPESALAEQGDRCSIAVVNPERKRALRGETAAQPKKAEPKPIAAPAPIAVQPPVAAELQPNAVALHIPAGVQYQHAPVRSGQQVYAKGRDLTLLGQVSAGAEVIADGSIHIYGRLAGKAIAGAAGDSEARIFCLSFQAELVSIAGRYRVFESIPDELRDRPCHLFLLGDKLEIQVMGN